jgi:hypothetical protein
MNYKLFITLFTIFSILLAFVVSQNRLSNNEKSHFIEMQEHLLTLEIKNNALKRVLDFSRAEHNFDEINNHYENFNDEFLILKELSENINDSKLSFYLEQITQNLEDLITLQHQFKSTISLQNNSKRYVAQLLKKEPLTLTI